MIGALAGGGFAVAWVDASASGGDTVGNAIRAQAFDAGGAKSGAEVLVNTTVSLGQSQPSLTALADGGFAVAWRDDSQTGADLSFAAVRAQILNADGTKSGGEFLVNTTTASVQHEPSLAALADGRFVAAWSDDSRSGGDTSFQAVRAQIFNGDGSKSGAEFLVNAITFLDQFSPSVAGLADGRFVVSWTAITSTTVTEIRAQMFNADGTRSVFEFSVNTTTVDMQIASTVAALPDGRFVIAWEDASQSLGLPDRNVVRAQVFEVDGSKSGAEIRVTVAQGAAAPGQATPAIAVLADGRIVIGWEDISGTLDTSAAGVHGRIFDPRTGPANLNGTLAGDDFFGTAHGDRLAGFLGDDTLRGAAGDDSLFGEEGDDALAGATANDRLFGGAGADTLSGGDGSDGLYGGSGADRMNGGFGADLLNGGGGDDLYVEVGPGDLVRESARGGIDEIRSASASIDLTLLANVENARLSGGLDLDLAGSALGNTLTGNGGDNTLAGGAGTDTLLGGSGADSLAGGLDADTLRGGTGSDTLSGGGQADVFVFASSAEASGDEIADFQAGRDDIGLSAFMAGATFIGAAAFSGTGPEVRYVKATGALSGDADGDGAADWQVLIANLAALTAGDFIV